MRKKFAILGGKGGSANGGSCRWCAPSPRLICTPSPWLLLLVFDVHPRLLLLLLLLPTAPTGPLILQNSVRHSGDIAAQFEAHRCTDCSTLLSVHSCTLCTLQHSVHTCREEICRVGLSLLSTGLHHTLIGTWTMCVLSNLHRCVNIKQSATSSPANYQQQRCPSLFNSHNQKVLFLTLNQYNTQHSTGGSLNFKRALIKGSLNIYIYTQCNAMSE